MSCPSFEDLLREGPDGHAAHCEACGALLEAWAGVDATLEGGLAAVMAPPSLDPAVRARATRELPLHAPSILPEILDFMGWAAVLAVAAILIPRYLPDLIRAVAARIG